MKKLIYLTLIVLLSQSCAMTCWYPLDGKKSNWCSRGKRAKKACKNNGGVDIWHYNYAKCKDGKVVGGIK